MALTKLSTVLNTVTSLATKIRGQATATKTAFETDVNVVKTYINDTLTAEVDTLDAQNVKLTGNQSIAGVKTFAEADGNWTGTWDGLSPTASDPGLAATVNAHLADNAKNILENGATAGGVVNNSTAIQNLINSLNDYDAIIIPFGTFAVETQITISKPLTVYWYGTLLVNSTGVAGTPIIKIAASNVTIMGNGLLDGNDKAWSGIQADNGLLENIAIDGIRFQDVAYQQDSTGGFVIGFNSVKNGRIRNNKIFTCGGYGIYIQFNNGTIIENNEIDVMYYAGINVSAGLDNQVKNNKVRNIKYFGMKGGCGLFTTVTADTVPSTTAFSVVKNANTAKQIYIGQAVFVAYDNSSGDVGIIKSIADNDTYYTLTLGTALASAPGAGDTVELPDTNTKWIDNTIEYTGDNGFDINITFGITCENNVIRFAGEYTDLGSTVAIGAGIWIGADPQGAVQAFFLQDGIISKNEIYNSYGSAIVIYGSPKRYKLSHNKCIHYNDSNGADLGGIEVNRLAYSRCEYVSISDNKCASVNGYGILINYSLYSSVENNIINSETGITIQDTVGYLVVDRNISVSTSTSYNILVEKTTNANATVFINKNTITSNGNGAPGIKIADTTITGSYFNDNTITTAGAGLKVYSDANHLNPNLTEVAYFGGTEKQHFSKSVEAGATVTLAKYTSDNGTIGVVHIYGFARSGVTAFEVFECWYYGNTTMPTVTFTSIGTPSASAFLAAGDFTNVHAGGNIMDCKYTNNEAGDVSISVFVEVLSRI
jgi:hypothetical protein